MELKQNVPVAAGVAFVCCFVFPSLSAMLSMGVGGVLIAGVGSFLLYSVHEGIRGIPLDPDDKSDSLVPVSGSSLTVGIDFHAGKSDHCDLITYSIVSLDTL